MSLQLLSELGLPFQEGDQASAARRNATMVMSGKGSQIAAIPPVQQIPFYRCLESTSGYLKDEVYVLAADGLSKKNIRRKHTHSADTDEEGGLFHNMFINNPRVVVFGQAPFNNLYDFNVNSAGAAGFTSIPDAVYGRTNYLTTIWDAINEVGLHANASVAGQQIGFDEKMLALATIYMDYNANQVARVGFGIERAENGIDIAPKIGMEMCGGTGINWQSVSCDGITRSTSATSMNAAPVPNGFKTYRMFFNPYNVSYKLSNTDGIVKVVTSTIPSGGTIQHTRAFRLGLNTTNPTTKHMWLLHLYFVAKNQDPTWFDSPE